MWQYSTREVPTLRDYEAAARHEAGVVALKSGPKKGKKPVGDRRQTYRIIERRADGSIYVGDDWGQSDPHNWVVYYPHGIISLQSGSYSSGMGFIGKVIGHEIHQRNMSKWIRDVWATRPDTGELIEGAFKVDNGVLEFRNDGYKLVLQNPTWPLQRRTNRTAGNVVRKRYARFLRYLRGVISLNEGVVFPPQLVRDFWAGGPVPELDARIPAYRPHVEEFYALIDSDEPADHHKAAVWLACTQKPSNHPSRWSGYFSNQGANGEDRYASDLKYMMNGTIQLLYERHAEDVFYMAPVFDGRVV